MKISFNQAREFLEEINEKDKVMIFTHKDLDGFASGILLMKFCEKKKAKVEVKILNYGTNKMSDYDLSNFNKILLADLAPSSVWDDFLKLTDKQILYLDHHPAVPEAPIDEKVWEFRTTEEGYIPSSRTCFELTKKENGSIKWLSIIGVLSDMGQIHEVNRNFLESFYTETGKGQDFYSKLTNKINSLTVYFAPEIEKGFLEFSKLKEPEDVAKIDKYDKIIEEEFIRLSRDYALHHEKFGKIIYFEFDSEFPAIKSALTTSFSSEDPKKIFIFVITKMGNLMSISARNSSREYDTTKLMQECLRGLKDGFAGGHRSATGGQVDRSDLEEFKKRLKKYNVETLKT